MRTFTRFIVTSVLSLVTLVSLAQVPARFNYQGIARNGIGGPIASRNITVRLSVIDGTPTGVVQYAERFATSTNVFGIFNLAVGGGSAEIGTFAGITWLTGLKYIKVEIDPDAGTNYVNMGTTQLLSVPYALYAAGANPAGPAGGDLSGTYPNPAIATNAVTSAKILDGTIGTVDLADGSVTTVKHADGSVTTVKLADASVTTVKLADNSVTTAKIVDANVTNAKLATNSVSTTNIIDGTIQAVDIAAGVIPTSLPPNGAAGGALTGTYPNPALANNSVSSANIVDGTIQAIDIAGGVIPTSLPPNGAAGGDLGGTYPNPLVTKLQGFAVSNTAPAANQVLLWNGASWVPSSSIIASDLTLPFIKTQSNAGPLFSLTNSGGGDAIVGINTGTGRGGFFQVNNAASVANAIEATTNGTGASWGIRATSTGTNGSGLFIVNNAANAGNNIQSQTNGVGRAGLFRTTNAANAVATFEAQQSGTGSAGIFSTTNASNASDLLSVNQPGTGRGIFSNAVTNTAIEGNSASGTGVVGITSGTGIGVAGFSSQPFAIAVLGQADNSYNVLGFTSVDGLSGFYNFNPSSNQPIMDIVHQGTGKGIQATVPSNTAIEGVSGSGNAVVGLGISQFATGVYGSSIDIFTAGVQGSSIDGFGVYGFTDPSSSASAAAGRFVDLTFGTALAVSVFGNSDQTGNANINGDLNITGTLSKGAGTFKIDHPLDPANKYLIHSFVESPDMMNVYNGNVTTDASGKATVDLPSYFGAENKDFKYQLTVIGQFAQAIIGKEISSNQFEIMTDKPNVKVSWQVTGVRQDAYANAHRIVPEVQKESKNIGRYLHPVELGKSKNLAIGSAVLTAAERNALQKKIQYVQQNSKKSVDFNALKTKVLAAKAAATTVNGGKK